jgi:Tannase and feruloyl esterase
LFDGGASNATGAPVPCAELSKLPLPDTTVTAAEEMPAGEYAPPAGPRQTSLPAFCRVALTVSPQIRIEVWLPKDTWNGRYRGEGGGGYAGQISYGGLAAGIRAGYATASTDTGHPSSVGGTFALNADGTLNTQAIVDFAERSLRELAIKSKAVIKAYYDTAPAYSYWNGCRRREDGTVLSRPLCPYPTTAKWTGSGSTDDAANFVCVDGQHRSGDFKVAEPPRK